MGYDEREGKRIWETGDRRTVIKLNGDNCRERDCTVTGTHVCPLACIVWVCIYLRACIWGIFDCLVILMWLLLMKILDHLIC